MCWAELTLPSGSWSLMYRSLVKLVIVDYVSERLVQPKDPAWCRMHIELFNVNLRQVLHLTIQVI